MLSLARTSALFTMILVLSGCEPHSLGTVATRDAGTTTDTMVDSAAISADARIDNGGTASSSYTVAFSTYLGGNDHDQIRDAAVDSQGNLIVVGGTMSSNYPTTAGVYQTIHNGGPAESSAVHLKDAFVTKISPAGHILWSTFIGGPNYDRAYAVEVDDRGHIYVGGRAGAGFPVTSGAFQTVFMGGMEAPFYGNQDGFVLELEPDGGNLVWSSYFGGSDPSIVRDIDIDAQGNVFLASGYQGGSFSGSVAAAFAAGAQPNPAGGSDAVVAKVMAGGASLAWASYLGGSQDESQAPTVRVDHQGNAILFTNTLSSNAPTTAGAYDRTYNGKLDAYVVKLSSDGARLWATFFGGSADDSPGGAHGGAVGPTGNTYISGYTHSTDLPTTPGVIRRTGGGDSDVDFFTAALSADGSRLAASTYYGAGEGVEVDAQGYVYFTNSTRDPSYPVTSDAAQSSLRGVQDGVVVKMAPDFSSFAYASYFGGATAKRWNEGFRAIAVGPNSTIYATGITAGADWPTTSGAFQSVHGGGGWDAVVVSFSPQ